MANEELLLIETLHLATSIIIGFLVLVFLRKHSKTLGTGAKLLLVGIFFLFLEQFLDVYIEITGSPNLWLHVIVETAMLAFILLALIIEMRASAKQI